MIERREAGAPGRQKLFNQFRHPRTMNMSKRAHRLRRGSRQQQRWSARTHARDAKRGTFGPSRDHPHSYLGERATTTLSNPSSIAGRFGGAKIVGDSGSDHSGPGPRSDGRLDPQRRLGRQCRGGSRGVGNKLFAVPWSALILDADRECFILDVPKERLETAPAFDKDRWPSTADPRRQGEIDRYYGARPYWE